MYNYLEAAFCFRVQIKKGEEGGKRVGWTPSLG